MGSRQWSDDQYVARVSARAATNAPAFAYDAAIKSGTIASAVHPTLDPKGVKVRESRDSDVHPNSRGVAVIFDHTGSMGSVPRILQTALPKLMGLLLRKGYLPDPQILIGAVGDAYTDEAPLQMGQFESGIEIEDNLTNLYLVGNGGGQAKETYELAAYFLARHTSMDCWEKRGQKGYAFIIGDEAAYPVVARKHVEELIGDKLEADISTKDIFAELQKTFHVFFVMPGGATYWNDRTIADHWKGILGERFLKLEDPSAICELIASTIGLNEGAIGMTELADDLAGEGSTAPMIASVSNALAVVGASSPGKGITATIDDSGAGSGLAQL
jgi:hypothetical protein